MLVDTLPDATAFNNGQEIGKTNSYDTLVVPTLYSFNQNEITLDVKNLPMDYSVSDVNVTISRPSGAVPACPSTRNRYGRLQGICFCDKAIKQRRSNMSIS